jgi:hypothetical protein
MQPVQYALKQVQHTLQPVQQALQPVSKTSNEDLQAKSTTLENLRIHSFTLLDYHSHYFIDRHFLSAR